MTTPADWARITKSMQQLRTIFIHPHYTYYKFFRVIASSVLRDSAITLSYPHGCLIETIRYPFPVSLAK